MYHDSVTPLLYQGPRGTSELTVRLVALVVTV